MDTPSPQTEPRPTPPKKHTRLLLDLVCVALLVGIGLLCWLGGKALVRRLNATTNLVITSDPTGSTVFLNDVYLGKTPLEKTGIPRGQHILKVTKHEYTPWKKAFVADQKEVTLRAVLDPIPKGNLAITSSPTEAEVYVAGDMVGRTPLQQDGLQAGTYEVRIQKDNYTPWIGEVQVRQGDLTQLHRELVSKTEEFYLSNIESEPLKIVNHTELGHYRMIQQDYEGAIKAFGRALDAASEPDADPEHARRLYQELDNVASAQYKYGDQAAVETMRPRIRALLEEAIERHRDAVRMYVWYGRFCRNYGIEDFAKSFGYFEKAVQAAPQGPTRLRLLRELAGLLYHHGSTLERQGRQLAKGKPNEEAKQKLLAAMQQYEAVIKRYPESFYAKDAFSQIIAIHRSQLLEEDPVKARELATEQVYRFIKSYPGDDRCADLQYRLGSEYASTKPVDYARAVEEYRKFMREYPKEDRCASAQSTIASYTLFYLKDYQKGIDEYRKFIKDYPEDDRCVTAQYYIAYYGYHTYLKDYPKAIEEYEKFLKDYPKDDRCPGLLGSIVGLYMNLKDYPKAIETYRRLLAQYPKSDTCVSAQAAIASIYQAQLKEYAKAIAEYETLIKKYPWYDGNALAFRSMGDCYLEMKDKDKAAGAFKQVLTQYPYSPEAATAEKSLAALTPPAKAK